MEIRLYDEAQDREELQRFNQAVFGASESEAQPIPSKLPMHNPYGATPGPTAIAVIDGRIVGHLTSTPFLLWRDGEEKLFYWLSGFHVLPETRGTGVGKRLVALLTQLFDNLSAVVVVEPSLRSFQANGWLYPGKIHEAIHIVNPSVLDNLLTVDRVNRFLPKPIKFIAKPLISIAKYPLWGGIRLYKAALDIKGKIGLAESSGFASVQAFDDRIDSLWARVRQQYALTHARNSENMNWQFPSDKGWLKAIQCKKGELLSYLLYTVKTYTDGGPLHGFTTLNIIDALWDTHVPEIEKELVGYILSLGYTLGVDLILISGAHEKLNSAARRGAFFRIPSTVYVGFWEGEKTAEYATFFHNAYITRGYADAAGGLGPA